MTYPLLCTVAQLKSRFPEQIRKSLTDDAASTTEDETREGIALRDASDLVYSYIGGLYTLPFTTVPNLITKITADITIINLEARWNEEDVARYDKILEMLGKIQAGTLSIYGATTRTMKSYRQYTQLDIPKPSLTMDDNDPDFEEKE